MGIPNSMKTPQFLMNEKDRKELTAARNHTTGNSKLSPISSATQKAPTIGPLNPPTTANFYDKADSQRDSNSNIANKKSMMNNDLSGYR